MNRQKNMNLEPEIPTVIEHLQESLKVNMFCTIQRTQHLVFLVKSTGILRQIEQPVATTL